MRTVKSLYTPIMQYIASKRYLPYLHIIRLDKPIGIILCLLPALWAVGLASHSFPMMIFYFFVMTIGAILARSAGCIINDIFDRDFDLRVTRTKSRPLASGAITLKQSLIQLAIIGGLAIALLFSLNKVAIITGLIFIPLIALYPLVKRHSYFPQVFLGLTFGSAGALIGWFAISPTISYTPILLYIAAALWTIGFDTIYAHQDKIDDVRIGVKSLALYLGDRTKSAVWMMYQFMMILMVIVGLQSHMNLIYYGCLAFAAYQLYWQSSTVNLDDPEDCAFKFKSNAVTGLIILLGIILGHIDFLLF